MSPFQTISGTPSSRYFFVMRAICSNCACVSHIIPKWEGAFSPAVVNEWTACQTISEGFVQ